MTTTAEQVQVGQRVRVTGCCTDNPDHEGQEGDVEAVARFGLATCLVDLGGGAACCATAVEPIPTTPAPQIVIKSDPHRVDVAADAPDVAVLLENAIRHAICWTDPWPLPSHRLTVYRTPAGRVFVGFDNEDDARTFHALIAPACNGRTEGQLSEALTVLRQLARAVGINHKEPHKIQERLAHALWRRQGGINPRHVTVRLHLAEWIDDRLERLAKPLRRKDFR